MIQDSQLRNSLFWRRLDKNQRWLSLFVVVLSIAFNGCALTSFFPNDRPIFGDDPRFGNPQAQSAMGNSDASEAHDAQVSFDQDLDSEFDGKRASKILLAESEEPGPSALSTQPIINPPNATQLSALELLLSDQRYFYSRENLRPFLLTVGTTAILANTRMDQEFSDWYQDKVRSSSTDDVAKFAKAFGEQWPMMGAYAVASITGRLLDENSRLAHWGDRSIRSMLVGVPPLLFLQKALGSSRPRDLPPSSNWGFWGDDNGASGHTFVGAVPFLVAAQMAEVPERRAALIALSTLPGWSRINDNDHYLSQVVVGWWLAYTATQAVEKTDATTGYEIAPITIGNATGLGISWRR